MSKVAVLQMTSGIDPDANAATIADAASRAAGEGAEMLFTPEMAASRAQVPVEQIEQAARWLGEAKRPYAGSGTGPSMATHSNLADHMIEVVNALAGGYRRARRAPGRRSGDGGGVRSAETSGKRWITEHSWHQLSRA